ncbi:MAG: alpha/beta fold hydrolase [Myxococcota bacterium]
MPTGWSPWADLGVHLDARLQRRVGTGRARLLDASGRRIATGDLAACEAPFRALQEARPDPAEHVVILLHGLFRSRGAMAPMARSLRAHGLSAMTVHYPSTRRDVDGHAEQIEAVLSRIRGPTRVSFVGHSLGGIVARRVLDRSGASWREHLTPHRLVTIGSPHHGAALAAKLYALPGFRAAAGPSLDELTPEGATPSAPPVPFGVIAGGRQGRGHNPFLDGDDDMTVRVEEAFLEGAEDALVVGAVHTFIMMDRIVIEAVRRYLGSGSFGAQRSLA